MIEWQEGHPACKMRPIPKGCLLQCGLNQENWLIKVYLKKIAAQMELLGDQILWLLAA